MPVRLTIRSKGRAGTWGKAFFPQPRDRRTIKFGEYAITMYIGTVLRAYPVNREYKKRAGPYTATCLVDEVVHTLAHEMRHVEQFEAYTRNCNVRITRNTFPHVFGRGFRIWEHSRRSGFPGGSCEVDAELVAHKLLAAYTYWLDTQEQSA
jgi:hypothetical protein